jgi:hypothetical protein
VGDRSAQGQCSANALVRVGAVAVRALRDGRCGPTPSGIERRAADQALGAPAGRFLNADMTIS